MVSTNSNQVEVRRISWLLIRVKKVGFYWSGRVKIILAEFTLFCVGQLLLQSSIIPFWYQLWAQHYLVRVLGGRQWEVNANEDISALHKCAIKFNEPMCATFVFGMAFTTCRVCIQSVWNIFGSSSENMCRAFFGFCSISWYLFCFGFNGRTEKYIDTVVSCAESSLIEKVWKVKRSKDAGIKLGGIHLCARTCEIHYWIDDDDDAINLRPNIEANFIEFRCTLCNWHDLEIRD